MNADHDNDHVVAAAPDVLSIYLKLLQMMMITILILHESTIKHRKKGPIQTFRACALGSSGRRVRPSCGSAEFLQDGKQKGFSSGGCQSAWHVEVATPSVPDCLSLPVMMVVMIK